MDVLARIKQLLDERNWSIYKLSKASGVAQSTLSNINPLAYLVAKVKTEIYSLNRLRKSINVLFERIKNTKNTPWQMHFLFRIMQSM